MKYSELIEKQREERKELIEREVREVIPNLCDDSFSVFFSPDHFGSCLFQIHGTSQHVTADKHGDLVNPIVKSILSKFSNEIATLIGLIKSSDKPPLRIKYLPQDRFTFVEKANLLIAHIHGETKVFTAQVQMDSTDILTFKNGKVYVNDKYVLKEKV